MPESLAVRRAETSTAITRVHEVLDAFAARDHNGETLTAVRHFPAREAQWADFPAWVNADLAAAYAAKGICRLYTHQAEAAEAVHAGKNVVIVTPTASGKTLCYNLPVLNATLENSDCRALYLFPTKALAQDQLAELHDLNQRLENRFGVFTYDGDTPADARRSIREKGHIVLTNPDMLHTGILPHHTRWTRLFENLRYIVLDELHTYRGVFGSHLCNVLRRLRRIARFYGRALRFICCSATIANPGELASRLLETEVEVLNSNGAPAAEKTFVFYNPPVVNRALGIRRSYITESSRVAQEFLKHDLQSGLRDGKIRGVVSTSALELGIDVGSLDTVVMAGYPGTIAATWQRAGRAGRRSGSSCAVLVASSSPLDQFIVRHPDYFFGNTPEHAFIQPDNLEILISHLKCAAFELPISTSDKFGDVDLPDLCARLAEAGFLHLAGENYHWTQEAYPADTISLRSVSSDNFVIIDVTGAPTVIGEVDFPSALVFLHEKAIYIHGGQQHHVEHLDFKERKAYVKRVDVGYYTDAVRYTQVRVLENADTSQSSAHSHSHGDVLVRSQVVGFKKIKFFTNENIGDGKLELPENEMHTTAYWITLERPLLESLPFTISERQSGMFGLLHALESVATLLLMCDRRDLGTAIGERPPAAESSDSNDVILREGEELTSSRSSTRPFETDFSPTRLQDVVSANAREFFEPNLYLYDAYPGGIGFSEPLFRTHDLLVQKISHCAQKKPPSPFLTGCVRRWLPVLTNSQDSLP